MKKLFLAVIVLLLSVSVSFAASSFHDARLYITDSPTVVLAWDPQPEGNSTPDYYDVLATCIETGQSWGYRTSELFITITKPRVGHFKFAVRACMNTPENEPIDCTGWKESIGQGASIWADGIFIRNDSWIIFWRLAPPVID